MPTSRDLLLVIIRVRGTAVNEANSSQWWKGATIYQIYPRSYCDANHDGMGDLAGITSKLDYVASLNVDAIWISPFFTSPMKDFGYDISDYRGIDPSFGVLDDFKQLLAKAHELGLKVIIDQVYSHTSDQHAWFSESRQSRNNSKADWYVWADAKADGSPPNNWLSLFGGKAWTWDSRREQYYLHNFLESQPDLNFHNPDVRQAQLDNARFWLDLGVDGFRLDVVNFYYHDKTLVDNPPVLAGEEKTLAVSSDNPYSMQRHKYDISQPENLSFLQDFRKVLDEYPNTTTIGEISADDPLVVMSEYTAGSDKLHMAYTFDLLAKQSSADYIRNIIKTLEARIGDGWPCWAISNHDVIRHTTRWGENEGEGFARVAVAMMLSMRGSVCLYQGDELGLPEADVPYEAIQDPYGLPFWPAFKGRDGCRTPMPWSVGKNAGFSSNKPWLPVDERHLALSVAEQELKSESTLKSVRQFVLWRKQQPALIDGDIHLLDVSSDMLCWIRRNESQQLLVAINMTGKTLSSVLPVPVNGLLEGHGFTGIIEGENIVLRPYDAVFAELG